MTRRDRDREMIRRVLTHRDRDREGRIGQPDCNFPPSARSRVRRDGYAVTVRVTLLCFFNLDIKDNVEVIKFNCETRNSSNKRILLTYVSSQSTALNPE